VKLLKILLALASVLSISSSLAQAQYLPTASVSSSGSLALTGTNFFPSLPGGNSVATLTVTGNQTSLQSAVLPVLSASTTASSPLIRGGTIFNDSTSTWNNGMILVSEPMDFTISSETSTWGAPTSVSGPSLVGGSWVATLDFSGGTPILPGGSNSFGYSYQVALSGGTSYPVTERINFNAVPEPSTLGLLVTGFAVAAFYGRAIRRQKV
jgi:hypothetical protein